MNIEGVSLLSLVPGNSTIEGGGAQPLPENGAISEGFANALMGQLALLSDANGQVELPGQLQSMTMPKTIDNLHDIGDLLKHKDNEEELAVLFGKYLPISYEKDEDVDLEAMLLRLTDTLNSIKPGRDATNHPAATSGEVATAQSLGLALTGTLNSIKPGRDATNHPAATSDEVATAQNLRLALTDTLNSMMPGRDATNHPDATSDKVVTAQNLGLALTGTTLTSMMPPGRDATNHPAATSDEVATAQKNMRLALTGTLNSIKPGRDATNHPDATSDKVVTAQNLGLALTDTLNSMMPGRDATNHPDATSDKVVTAQNLGLALTGTLNSIKPGRDATNHPDATSDKVVTAQNLGLALTDTLNSMMPGREATNHPDATSDRVVTAQNLGLALTGTTLTSMMPGRDAINHPAATSGEVATAQSLGFALTGTLNSMMPGRDATNHLAATSDEVATAQNLGLALTGTLNSIKPGREATNHPAATSDEVATAQKNMRLVLTDTLNSIKPGRDATNHPDATSDKVVTAQNLGLSLTGTTLTSMMPGRDAINHPAATSGEVATAQNMSLALTDALKSITPGIIPDEVAAVQNRSEVIALNGLSFVKSLPEEAKLNMLSEEDVTSGDFPQKETVLRQSTQDKQGFNLQYVENTAPAEKTLVIEKQAAILGIEQAAPGVTSDMIPLHRQVDNKTDIPAITRPLTHPGWSKDLGEQIVWMNNKAIPAAEIRLNPAHLGPISVRIDVNQDQATILFTAQHAEVKEAIEASIPKLREMLGTQQLNLVNVNISQNSTSDQGRSPSQTFSKTPENREQGIEGVTDTIEKNEHDRVVVSKGLLSIYA